MLCLIEPGVGLEVARGPNSGMCYILPLMSMPGAHRRFFSAFLGGIVALLASIPSCAGVHKITENLYAYISENDSSSNSTFLITSEGILVVDTGLNEEEGRRLLAEIRKVSNLPVRYIVNTHYHPDHRGGNNVVGPGATVISTTFTFHKAGGGLL